MVRLQHKYKITFNAPVILGFVIICFVVMVVDEITNGVSTRLFFMTYHSSLTSFMTYVRMLTHVLGHMGWEHFIGNMSYILLLGPMLEEKYGSICILKVIVVVAAITGIINY